MASTSAYKDPKTAQDEKSRTVFLDGVASGTKPMDLFCDPPKQMIWDEKPLWSPAKMFNDGDEISKSLLNDIRASLTTSKSASYASQFLPSAHPLNKCFSQMPTVQKVSFDDNDMKMLGTSKRTQKSKTPVQVTILKRPTADVKSKLKLDDEDLTAQKAGDEAISKLEQFCKNGDFKVFEKALKLCMKSLRLTYYAICDLSTHPEGKNLDVKNGLLTNFASLLERAYLKSQQNNSKLKDLVDESKTDKETEVQLPKYEKIDGQLVKSIDSNVIDGKALLLQKLFELPANETTKPKAKTPMIDDDQAAKEEEQFFKAFEMFLIQTRKHHLAFIAKLSTLLGGYDPNLMLKRDLSGNYAKLISIQELKQIPQENVDKFNAIKPFLYREFMNMGALERIAIKSFKLDGIAMINPADYYLMGATLNMSCVYFAKAALVDANRITPFEGLISICNDRSYLTRYLFALCGFVRDRSNRRPLAVELKNLSKLYVKFLTTFTLIYDAIFNHNYRRGNPFKRMKNQRWLFPDGVKDPLYNADPAKRICNHLSRFVDEELVQLFKYYHYWSGIRLLMFIGYKIIDRLDLDQFDEQIQVALYGLSVGLSAKVADSVHLVQLAKFLIAVATVCEQQNDLDTEQRAYRTACRLLIEYFALILQKFNDQFKITSLHETLKNQLFSDEMLAFLLPITLMTHWMSHCPLFFKNESWNRKWSFSILFTADFWPELSVFGNNLRLLKNNGMFNAISSSTDCTGQIIPELANSFGISSVFNEFPPRFVVDTTKLKVSNVEVMVRLFSIWENIQTIALLSDNQYFVYHDKKGFEGHSDEKRFLVTEPDYFDTPELLPVPLDEIENCINNRKKEVEAEQKRELENLIELAKSEAKNKQSILQDKMLVIIRPRHLVIDTNSFIDALDTILSLLEDPYLTVYVPLPVISELKGLRNKKSASPNADDEDHARQVSMAAVRSLQVLESIKKDNIKLLLRKGRALKMDINYQDLNLEAKVNNDRLIIETAKEFSEKICPKSIRVPRGHIWMFRDVLLVTKDRVMMLLANAYRLPSLDIETFSKWCIL